MFPIRILPELFPNGNSGPDFAAQVPLMSLPGILGTRLESIPNEVPYLRVDPEMFGVRVGEIGDRFAASGFQVRG